MIFFFSVLTAVNLWENKMNINIIAFEYQNEISWLSLFLLLSKNMHVLETKKKKKSILLK